MLFISFVVATAVVAVAAGAVGQECQHGRPNTSQKQLHRAYTMHYVNEFIQYRLCASSKGVLSDKHYKHGCVHCCDNKTAAVVIATPRTLA
jgi:hypothetical protein